MVICHTNGSMLHIRTTKTTSSAVAVQVVRYVNRQMQVLAHIGSAHNKDELAGLKNAASCWMEKYLKQKSLFASIKDKSQSFSSLPLVPLTKCQYLGIRYHFIYKTLSEIFRRFGFDKFDRILIDLVLIRIVEPASKLRSLELLNSYFGIKYHRQDFYRKLSCFSLLKDKAETKILKLAKKELNFHFSLVFYDVTTLYFESFCSDELRELGFSKDNKPQQPQILIGLVVNTEGFPVAYDIFHGKTFEGHTLIPTILKFKRKHNIKKLTVVADAAMISFNNIQLLNDSNLNYIVGARVGNLSRKLIAKISQNLNSQDKANMRIKTLCGDLVCDFSLKRYKKDKSAMEKQLKKAQELLDSPAKIKRTKFLKTENKTNFQLNKELIEKTTQLLGIKGYYTNLSSKIDNKVIVSQYHSLWHVEQSFRLAKSDLQIRPIYHFRKEAIYTHILICFMALTVCKYLEIKTNKSTKYIIDQLKSITDARIYDTLSQKEFLMRIKLTKEIKIILSKLNLSY